MYCTRMSVSECVNVFITECKRHVLEQLKNNGPLVSADVEGCLDDIFWQHTETDPDEDTAFLLRYFITRGFVWTCSLRFKGLRTEAS